jgi:hypothetical protein
MRAKQKKFYYKAMLNNTLIAVWTGEEPKAISTYCKFSGYQILEVTEAEYVAFKADTKKAKIRNFHLNRNLGLTSPSKKMIAKEKLVAEKHGQELIFTS